MQNNLPFIRVFAKRFPVITVMTSAIAVLASIGVILSAEFNANVTHLISAHASNTSLYKEIVMIAVSSLTCVMLVFLVFFRSLKGLLYVLFPVVTAMFMTLGITLLFSHSLSEETGAFVVMFAALSIDLGIVLYVRYLVTVEDGANPVEHMDRTIKSVYRGITIGALTTVITFLPMVFTSFPGIRELGLLISIGMILCWLILFTLTALTIKPSSGRFIAISELRALAVFSFKRPFVVITAVLCSSLLSIFFIPRIQVPGDITKPGAALISLIALALVNIILYFDFRRLSLVIICQAPVAISTICTLGIIGITGISLTFMDAIIFALLFGIGTDYTIYLLHQYLIDRDIGRTFLQTGKAVLVAGLTTIAGFGSIGFSSYKGLATMGQIGAIGVTLCVILSLTLVPALLRIHEDQDRQ